MATLLHDIHPLMQRSIAETEEHLERKIANHTEWKIGEVHHYLDAFVLWVLDRPVSFVDVSTLRTQCWLLYSLHVRFHYLPLKSMSRGAEEERSMRIG